MEEIKFWKVYRNIYLNKILYSNFKFSKVYSYERLFNVEQILLKYTNGSEIIKDKVKNKQYLFFENKKTGETFPILILSSIRNDELFYNHLFNFYSKHFNLKELLNKIINTSNISALKSLIKNIYNNDTNCIIQYNEIFKIINYKNIKMLNYLISIGKEINFSNNFEFKDDQLYNGSFKLKHLIEILKFICKNHNEGEIYQDYLYQIINSQLFTNQIIQLSINQILEKYSSILNSSELSEIKEEILKLINLFYLFIKKNNDEIPLNYFILFKNEKEIQDKLFHNYESSQLYQYDQYECFINLFKYNSEYLYQFISNHLNNIKSSKQISKSLIDEIEYNIYSSIISNGNEGLLERIIKDHSINYFKEKQTMVFSKLQSVNILNYFYKNYQDLFFKNLNTNWVYIESMEIYKLYKQLMVSLNRNLFICNRFQIQNQFFTNSSNNKKVGEMFLEILLDLIENNPSNDNQLFDVLSFGLKLNLDPFKEIVKNSLKYYNKQEAFIKVLKTFKFKSFDVSLITDDENNNNYQIIKWILDNSLPFEFKKFKNTIKIQNKNYSSITSKEENEYILVNSVNNDIFFIFLFKMGYYKEIFQFMDNNLNSRMKFLNYHFYPDNYNNQFYFNYITPEYIDLLFNYLFENKTNKIEIMEIGFHSKKFNWETFINQIIRTGDLRTYKHLTKNYGPYIINNQLIYNLDFIEFDETLNKKI